MELTYKSKLIANSPAAACDLMNTLNQTGLNNSSMLQATDSSMFNQVALARSAFDSLRQVASLFDPLKDYRDFTNVLGINQRADFLHSLEYFNARQADLTEAQRRAFKLFAALGFAGLEAHLTDEQLDVILRVHRERRNIGVKSLLFSMFRRNRYRMLNSITREWWRVPYMTARRKEVRQAIQAHKNRQYGLSIPAMLTWIDGLASEVASTAKIPGKGTNRVIDIARRMHEIEDSYFSECTLEIIRELIYKSYDFTKDSKPPSSVNRHGILHGRTARYSSEQNSYRVLFLLDVMARLWLSREEVLANLHSCSAA